MSSNDESVDDPKCTRDHETAAQLGKLLAVRLEKTMEGFYEAIDDAPDYENGGEEAIADFKNEVAKMKTKEDVKKHYRKYCKEWFDQLLDELENAIDGDSDDETEIQIEHADERITYEHLRSSILVNLGTARDVAEATKSQSDIWDFVSQLHHCVKFDVYTLEELKPFVQSVEVLTAPRAQEVRSKIRVHLPFFSCDIPKRKKNGEPPVPKRPLLESSDGDNEEEKSVSGRD